MSIAVVRERVIETYLFSQCKKIGAMCVKQEPRYNAGIPDRLVMYAGLAVFVEVKRPGGTPTERQDKYHDRLGKVGMGVVVIDTKEKVDVFITRLLNMGKKG